MLCICVPTFTGLLCLFSDAFPFTMLVSLCLLLPLCTFSYFDMGAVTEFQWGNKLGEKYKAYKPAELITGSVKVGQGWGLHPSDHACNFLDNHG